MPNGRSVDPDEIEEVGSRVCPAIADEYAEILNDAPLAGRLRDGAIGGNLGVNWADRFTFFYNSIYETKANIRSRGKTLGFLGCR